MTFRIPLSSFVDQTARNAAAAAQQTANGANSAAAAANSAAAAASSAAAAAQSTANAAAAAANNITTTQIADGAISTPKLAAGAVTAATLAAGAVTAGKLAAGAVQAGTIAAGAIDGQTITGATVRTANPATAPAMQLYEASDANGRWGVLEADDPAADAPGSLTMRLNAGAGGSVQGSLASLKGLAANGIAAPELDLSIEAKPSSGYWRVARLPVDLFLPQGVPIAAVSGGTLQTVASGGFVALVPTTTLRVQGGMTVSAGVITVPVSGLYLVSGTVEFTGNATGRRMAGVQVNGTVQNQTLGSEWPTTAAVPHVPTACLPLVLAGGDRIQLVAYQDSGASLSANLATSVLQASYLGPSS